MTQRFVLIDRDGTLNVEKNYLKDPEDLVLIPGSGQALKKLNDAGFGVCVITNQSGIARGYFTEQQLQRIHARLEEMVGEFGGRIDAFYFCPHAPEDGCDCRKPLPGLVHRAMAEHGFSAADAWMIGDKELDIELGRTVGAKSILVRTGYGKKAEATTCADFVADDLAAAADLILSR